MGNFNLSDQEINESVRTNRGDINPCPKCGIILDADGICQICPKAFEKSPDEITAEILSRFSVLDLVEQTEDSLDAAEEKYRKGGELRVVGSGEENLIRWWRVQSRGERYEVRRFENFIFCSCPDFFFKKTTCRHTFVTTKAFAKLKAFEHDNSPYLKATDKRKLETIGGVRF